MDELLKFIFEQIDNLTDYKNSKPKSVVIFGIQKNEISELFLEVSEYFNKKKYQLISERLIEKDSLFKSEFKNVIDKYNELIDRYKGTDKIEYILGLKNEAFEEKRKQIERSPTELKKLIENLELINLDVYKFHNNVKRKEILDDTLDFSDLKRYNETKEEYRYNKLSDKEKEYIELHEYESKHRYPKYVFIHNFYESEKTDWTLMGLMRTIFKWDYLIWSIICIEANNEFWEKNKSDELKFEVYYHRKIFDLAEKITPIENRLKKELDNAGISYKFQYPVGKYILDFFIQKDTVKLNVECDGKEFHSDHSAIEYDSKRNLYMEKNGFTVIRFPGVLVWNNPELCVEKIKKILNH